MASSLSGSSASARPKFSTVASSAAAGSCVSVASRARPRMPRRPAARERRSACVVARGDGLESRLSFVAKEGDAAAPRPSHRRAAPRGWREEPAEAPCRPRPPSSARLMPDRSDRRRRPRVCVLGLHAVADVAGRQRVLPPSDVGGDDGESGGQRQAGERTPRPVPEPSTSPGSCRPPRAPQRGQRKPSRQTARGPRARGRRARREREAQPAARS